MFVKKAALSLVAAAVVAGFAVDHAQAGCHSGYSYSYSYYPRTYYAPRPIVVAKPVPVAQPVAVAKPVAPPATIVPVGAVITLPGHGFGTVPGRVLLSLPGLQLHVPIGKWAPCSIQVKIPDLALTCPTLAKLQILRADGFQIAPIPLKLTPAAVQGIVIGTPGAAAAPAAAAGAVVQPQLGQTGFAQPNGAQNLQNQNLQNQGFQNQNLQQNFQNSQAPSALQRPAGQ